ncbi:putative repeat protein (TIGR01451 family) [Paenibacillus rhizosphaerae]|uniref:Putative repeat protein (TIGR01451 family) n=1 Tax=Paenibacillus rhizosphaerae TaxID=297318 RepID=A0A839TQ13_9BACL|nr:SBBP repeat-containing protein [Paenibacillus rhizosphaerae]MBB3128651.1 putative repeat protein (TIGR01451 family) [Paenibacillus rhizosphaerae]
MFNGDAREEREGRALSLEFLRASPAVKLEARRQGLEKINYLLGNDPAKWQTGLSAYREIIYRELWQGVDMIFFGEGGKLKYELVVQPEAKLDSIQFAYRGADRLSLDKEGNLLIHTPFGVLTEERPVSFQQIAGKRAAVESRFVIKQSEPGTCVYGFEIDEFHPGYALIIDPALDYSTYLGGSGTETGFAIAVDGAGNAYVTGQTVSSNFPLTSGAFQATFAGSSDAFVTKLNAHGSGLVYSTFIGGSGLEIGFGIAVDSAGNAYVTGQTQSTNFPVTNGALQTLLGGGSDAFVTKLNADGSALVYSTYLGGSSGDVGNAIIVDGTGNAYVTGSTASTNFPTTSGAFQTTGGGALADVFVTKLNADGTALDYSTYLVGSSLDEGFGIAVDGSGNAFVTGRTLSANFPTTPGAFQIASAGSADAFAFKLNAGGTALMYSTYLGGSGSDTGKAIAIDGSGNAYIVGLTFSADFPVTPGAFQPSFGGVSDVFVTKLSSDGTSLVYSTYLGGSGSEDGTGIEVLAGSAYVTGNTGSSDFPVTPDSIQPTLSGGSDVYLTQFDVTGSSLVFSTYFGGSSNDGATSIAVDGSGSAYLTGQTVSLNYPITPGAFQQSLAGGGDSFVTKIGANAEISLLKFPDRFEVRPGETVTFFIEITNPSVVTLTNVRIEDPQLGFFTVLPELPPFAVQIFEVFFHVPPEAPPGFITNVVTVISDQIPEPQFTKSEILVTEAPALLLTKTVNPPAAAPGELVIFTITIQNMGNVGLINVRITDPLIGLDETINEILVGETVTINWPFVIPPEALAGVTIANLVQVTADNLPEPETVGAVVEVLAVPRLTLTKTADRTAVPPGETVTFTITLSNSGNSDLTNISVTDDLTGFSTVIPLIAVGQTDILHVPFFVPLESPPQTYINTVTAVSNETEPVTTSAEVTVSARPLLGVSKVPSSLTVTPGETITYTITLSNIGNVPLTSIRLADPLLGLDQTLGTIEVGETTELTIPFTLPQGTPIGSDIVNLLTVTSAEAGTQEVESTVTVTGAGLSLSKQADLAVAFPGETITYTLTVTNLMVGQQTNVILRDLLLGLSETVPVLLSGETITQTVTFTVPLDAPAGSVITNTFTVSSDQTPPQETTAEVVIRAFPVTSLVLHKLPDRNTAFPGETITYTLTVTNLLPIPQTNVVLADPLLGLSETVPVLLPGETITRTETFPVPPVTPAGSVITNTFTVSSDQSPQLITTAEVAVQALPGPGLVIQKLPDRNGVVPGETITYTLTVTNLLAVPQTNVVLTDTLLGLNETVPVLLPSETITRTASFPVPLDTPIGSTITNTFTASSDQTPVLETTAEVIVQSAPGPGLVIHKLPDRNVVFPGETITYTLTVTNLLAVPQTNVVLADAMLGLSETVPVLLAGETTTRAATFTVPVGTPMGSTIINTFMVSSDQTPAIETTANVVVQAFPVPSLVIQKLPDRNAVFPGETITYTLTVTNLLSIPQTNVILTDELLGLSETVAVLLAGETITRTVTFTVPLDAPADSVITNTITVSSDQTTPLETTVEVVVESALGVETTLEVLKLPDRNEAAPGETVHYTVLVTNTGSNPATNVVVNDSLTGTMETIAAIAPGNTAVVTFAFTIPVTAVNGTVIANRVTATWTEQPPGSPPAQSETRVTVADPIVLLELDVQGHPSTANPGRTVIKTITITNVTGRTVTHIRVSDSLVGFRTVIASLAPGEQRVFNLPFAIPAGTTGGTVFPNIVTIISDQTPLQQETVFINTTVIPDAELTETVDRAQGRPGETVIFTIQVRNTGNVALTNAVLTAPLLGIQFHISRFEVGAIETIQVPFVLPNVNQTTVIISPVTFSSDNGPFRTASASVEVIVEAQVADAQLTETVDPNQGRPGQTVIFTIQVVNTGNITLFNGKLIAPLLGVQQQIDRLDPGTGKTLHVSFILPDVKENTTITSPVTFTSDNGPTRRASASVLVIAEEEE